MDRYAPENLIFFDFESRSPVPIERGSYRYAVEADAVLLAYAIGLGPVQLVDRRGKALGYGDLPDDLRQAYESGKVFCAWNTNFDRCVWNYALDDSPFLAPGQVIDARAAALAHNLPDDLETASTRLGGPGKRKDGKSLIARFCGAKAVMAEDDPEAWERFCLYARQDVEELRRVFRLMLPAMTGYDWSAYQANEVVNDNGAGVDLQFCREAARLASEDTARTNARLAVLTNGAITTIYQHLRIAQWVHDRLPSAEARLKMSIVYKEEAEGDDDEDLVEKVKLTISRGVVERLLDMLRATGCDDKVLMEVLELREFGASAAPKKFQAILNGHIDGRVYGQFVFNGGGQTGRFSGKNIQLQNLTRTVLGKDAYDDYGYWEDATVALISDGCTLDELAAHGNGEVPARKLALTIRPAFIAKGTRTLIKADYAQIEARVLPWLSKSRGGEELLDSFRRADADPSEPDLYRVTAAGMTGKKPEEISKEERQRGKVAVLACGFGGGRNALHSMAANYRMHFTDAEAQAVVDAWRLANPWAPTFWGRHTKDGSYGLFGAARQAIEQPLSPIAAGRVTFVYVPIRRDGTLLCILPSGRPLIYPSCRMRDYDIVDKTTKKVLDTRHGLTFRRARGIIALYGGRFAENCLAGGTPVLTRHGWVSIEKVTTSDMLWDGIAWVHHKGLISQGVQACMTLNGVLMTPEHKVLSDDGWIAAKARPGLAQQNLRLPDGSALRRHSRDQLFQDKSVEMPLQLRDDHHPARAAVDANGAGWLLSIVPGMPKTPHGTDQANPWHVETSSVHGMVLDASAMPGSTTVRLEKLRWPWDRGLREVGQIVRRFLARHGLDLGGRERAGPYRQQRTLPAGQLPLGDAPAKRGQSAQYASNEHATAVETTAHTNEDIIHPLVPRPVYDLRNAGPRSRFVVRGDDGPFVVSNCTQATAADLLREAIVRLVDEKFEVVSHSHDEIVVECERRDVERTMAAMKEAMVFDRPWAAGLPLAVDMTERWFYSAKKDAA